MKRTSWAAGLVLVPTTVLVGLVIAANAQLPAQESWTVPVDEQLAPFRTLEKIDVAPPPGPGDDKAACDRATRAQARFEAGLSTARERSRAFEHAKSLAATAGMRRAIESGVIPGCPPDADPTEVQP